MFQRIGTRSDHRMVCPTGIRWESVYPLMDRMGLSQEAWDELLAAMEVMEIAAVKAMNKKRK